MARKNTTAPAPAPGNGPDPRKIRNLSTDQLAEKLNSTIPPQPKRAAPLKVAHIDPARLAEMTPEELKEALQAATVTKTASRRDARPRVTLSPEAVSLFQELGWSTPYANANTLYKPQPRSRFNNSKGAAAYTVAVAALQVGQISLTDLGRLWLASGNPAKLPGQIAQQIANRAGRTVKQTADKLALI